MATFDAKETILNEIAGIKIWIYISLILFLASVLFAFITLGCNSGINQSFSGIIFSSFIGVAAMLNFVKLLKLQCDMKLKLIELELKASIKLLDIKSE